VSASARRKMDGAESTLGEGVRTNRKLHLMDRRALPGKANTLSSISSKNGGRSKSARPNIGWTAAFGRLLLPPEIYQRSGDRSALLAVDTDILCVSFVDSSENCVMATPIADRW
jgi:hypothetical protein